MTYANQFDYDRATESDLDGYQEEKKFAEFAEHVTLELLAGRDCQGIDSQIFMIDLELEGGGYQLALEWVCDRVTERQYRDWIGCLGVPIESRYRACMTWMR